MEDNIVIQVRDNGIGIEQSELEKIRGELNDNLVIDRKSYGLYNVNERLRFYNSKMYGIEISSIVGEGTLVEITIPQEI